MSMTPATTFVIPVDRFMASGANVPSFTLPAMARAQQQPGMPEQSPALPPQPGQVDQPRNPLPGNPPVMPQPTPPETRPHPGF